MNVIGRSGPYSLNRLSMSSSVISAKGLSNERSGRRALLLDLAQMRSKTSLSSPEAFLTRSRTSPSELRSSKITTRITRLATIEMWMLSLLALVEEDRELLLADQPGEPVGGGDVAGGERGERGGVEVLDLALRGDLLAVLVDQEDDLGVGVHAELQMIPLIWLNSSSYITMSGAAIP